MKGTQKIPKKIPFADVDFQKSSFSPAYPIPKIQCVQVARNDDLVAIRDSKDPIKTTLVFNNDEWNAFVMGVKAGEFNI